MLQKYHLFSKETTNHCLKLPNLKKSQTFSTGRVGFQPASLSDSLLDIFRLTINISITVRFPIQQENQEQPNLFRGTCFRIYA